MSEKSKVDRIIEAENEAINTFEDKWKTAKDNARFYSLKHWTVQEEDKLKRQNRQPFKFDKTSHAMNVLLGTQREGRLDIQYLERKPEDAARSQVMNSVWKYYADRNEFIYRESDVFQDGIINQAGIFEVGIDKSKLYAGELIVSRVPFDECMWDTNARQYDLIDAAWFSRRTFYRRNELIVRYPEKRELIETISWDRGTETGVKPQKNELWYDPKKGLIGVREFYERDYKTKYMIWQVGSEEPEPLPYETKEGAEAEIARRSEDHQMLTNEALSVGAPVVPAPQFEVLPFDVPIVNKTCAMLNGVLDESEYDLGDFPFSVYFAYFNDGDYWTAIERMKDPQVFYNRMMIQADYWVGVMAKGLVRGDSRESKATQKAIREAWGKTGGYVTSKYPIEQIESKGPAPQIFSMMDRAENIMDESFGGANILGLKQTASESGRAVLARQAQAGLDNFVPLDNFRRTKLDLGKKIAWFLTNKITSARKLRISGNSFEIQQLAQQGLLEPHPLYPTQGYMEVNTKPENTLAELEVDIVVGEAQYSPNRMMAALTSMTDAFKAGMVSQPPPPEVAIGILPIPEDMKQKWLALFQPKSPEPKIAMNISYKDLPPGVQAQVEELLGFKPMPDENVMQKIVEAKSKEKPKLTEKEKALG